ncbi:tyrosine-protein phosphatase non-receptor type 7-like [Osmerus mordax]|uniref:tyrosine-protein phosphatase non-receptor type 7-like n=1 Tax=Osmerus mordax TaxID=8014 RepID=UPI00350F5FC2
MSDPAERPTPTAEDDQSASCIAVSPPRRPIRLQERRGSNVSLVLDVSSLAAVEPLCSISTPRETLLRLLKTSSRPLTHTPLQHAATVTHTLNTEYQKIPPNFVNPTELDIPGRALKDRYKSILPNPETRVTLRSHSAEEKENEGYINANYIKGYEGIHRAYIATQGPMANTVQDFWEMVWQEQSAIIVMITKLKEKNEKCELYWPHQKGSYGRFDLCVTSVTDCVGYTVRELTLQLGTESREVRHYWYSTWPDHQTPECSAHLLRLVEEVEDYKKSLPHSPGPIIVHCSAGIGRTGCFIASCIGCQQLRHSRQVDILRIVCSLRLDRGGMVQTTEQYQFLYATLAQYSTQMEMQPTRPQEDQGNPESQGNKENTEKRESRGKGEDRENLVIRSSDDNTASETV